MDKSDCIEKIAIMLKEGDVKTAEILAYECAKMLKAKREAERAELIKKLIKRRISALRALARV